MTYNYAELSGQKVQNRLYSVDDLYNYDDEDIDDMDAFVSAFENINNGKFDSNIPAGNNYRYDATGQLIEDHQEGIAKIVWRVDGKIKAIIREEDSTKTNLVFDYDPMGNRIAKHVHGNQSNTSAAPFDVDNPTDWEKTTYYNRDAQGNVMAIYEYHLDTIQNITKFTLAERNIYGSSRVGMNINEIEIA